AGRVPEGYARVGVHRVGSVDHVVDDDAAPVTMGVRVLRALAENDAALAVDDGVRVDLGIVGAVPHQDGGPVQIIGGRLDADIADQVVANPPVRSIVDVDALRVAVAWAHVRVFDHRVLDGDVVNATRVRGVNRALQQLFPGVEEPHVVDVHA